MIKANNEVKAILQSEVLDTAKEIRMMGDKLHTLIEEIEEDKENNKVSNLVLVFSEIRKILKLQFDMMQKFENQPKAQNINYIDQSIKVIGILDGLAEEGYIKILKDLPDYNKDKV
jgi:hypothetical protein